MIDSKSVKGLEMCTTDCMPTECPYYDDYTECRNVLMRDALSLINRQQAEIERLQAEVDKQYEIAEANVRAEIASGGTSCHWCEDKVRAEAIKEFAERLKDKASDFGFVKAGWVAYIDNLVKEMVGE